MSEGQRREAPFGTWPSPITAAKLVEGVAAVGELRVDGDDVWWSESRPSEGGRTQLVRRTPDGALHDVLGDDHNARTRVHEYGGGAWCAAGGTVWWNDWSDQRIRRLDVATAAGGAGRAGQADRAGQAGQAGLPTLVTPEPAERHGWRHADLIATPDRQWVLCVREEHGRSGTAEAVNELVAVPADGSAAEDASRIVTVVSGPDFVSSPRPSPDGRRLAWTQWSHPRMPWDGTELWVANFDSGMAEVSDQRRVAGGPTESIVQPEWSSVGEGAELLALSDRSGWWLAYRFSSAQELLAEPEALIEGDQHGEIGGPQWVFGLRWYAPLRGSGSQTSGAALVAVATHDGVDQLGLVHHGAFHPSTNSSTAVGQVAAAAGEHTVAAVVADFCSEPAPVRINLVEGGQEVLRPPRNLGFGSDWFSEPEHISFPTTGGATAHALYYPPHNPSLAGPTGQKPPLLVLSHGGPTAAARSQLDLAKQFWTSRGFAVVDVNYRGSTGYGRPYRDALQDTWGVVDVDDCVAAARHLVDAGEVDGGRLAIRGGSAGGYTTLCALAFHDVFAAGASHYGVADLGALARDTHKFESRYLDGLVGPWPEAEAVYAARSPINHTDGFDRPLIVLQGDEDEVVPPAQARMIVDALAAKGVPHAYLLFEGEQHGFRRAENIVRALEAELWFYGQVFGFDPADSIEPVSGAVGLG